jgi:hypothetical protein
LLEIPSAQSGGGTPAAGNRRERDDEAVEDADRPRRSRRRDVRDDEDEDRGGAKPPKKARSKKGLIIGLAVGGGVLLMCCCTGVIGGFVYWFYPDHNPKVTLENYDRLKIGMTYKEVEDILGSGKKVARDDIANKYKANLAGQKEQDRQAWERPISQNRAYHWKNGDNVIFAVLDKPPDQGGKVSYLELIFYTAPNSYTRKEQGRVQ